MSAVEPVPPPTPSGNLAGSPSTIEIEDAAVGASALRKASVRLIPLIAIAYGVAYTDRVNISFAALQMNRDLHFSASAYGLGAGLFFLSYALARFLRTCCCIGSGHGGGSRESCSPGVFWRWA